MAEDFQERLGTLKIQFKENVEADGKKLTDDKRVTLATNIAQQEFITNFYSTLGIDYLNKALNWPPTYEKTTNRQYPEVSEQQNMVALATYELLESCSGGLFFPPEGAAILVSDVARFADKLKSEKDLTISEFGDILFARFANATIALAGFGSKERRDQVFDDLQDTVSKVQETFSLAVTKGYEQIGELVELFNETKWDRQSLLEGRPIYLVENLFRAYQGLPTRKSSID